MNFYLRTTITITPAHYNNFIADDYKKATQHFQRLTYHSNCWQTNQLPPTTTTHPRAPCFSLGSLFRLYEVSLLLLPFLTLCLFPSTSNYFQLLPSPLSVSLLFPTTFFYFLLLLFRMQTQTHTHRGDACRVLPLSPCSAGETCTSHAVGLRSQTGRPLPFISLVN